MSVRDIIQAASSGSGGNPNAWDVSKASYSPGDDAGDVSASVYVGTVSVSGQETFPAGVFFSSDGTKMYVCGSVGDDVNQYTLANPWIVSSASYVQNFSVSGQDTAPASISFKPDGTKMYILGGANDRVYQYSLSTPWDVSTASYDSVSFSVSTQEATPTGMFFKPDGTKMYIIGTTGDDVNEYNLGTAWNVSTASYVQAFSVAGQEVTPVGVSFTADGAKMYVVGSTGGDINEYSLSTAWNVSTASYVQNFSIASQETSPSDLYMRGDGAMFYVVGLGDVYQYVIGGFSVASRETIAQGVVFKPDGTRMYVIGQSSDAVNQYSLSTPWDITTATYQTNFSVSSQETNPTGVYFKPDGTSMFIIGTANATVYEYSVASAWDLSGFVNYQQGKTVSSQTSAPTDVFFRPNGTNMYVTSGLGVWQFTLSTAWDISSAGSPTFFSSSTQDNANQSVYFRTDGALMVIAGDQNDKVYSYTLATPWDVTSASFSEEVYVGFGGGPTGVFFNPNGEEFFTITAGAADKVFSFVISPE